MLEKRVRKWNLKIKQPIIDNRKLCYWWEIIKKVKPSYTEEIEEKEEITEHNKKSVKNDESHYL